MHLGAEVRALLDAFWVPDEELVAFRERSPVPRTACQEEFMACPRKGHKGNGTSACVANSQSRQTRKRESRIDGGQTGVKMMPRSHPHFGGVHTGSPEGPAHGTKDRISSSSGRVAPGESTLAGCPRGLQCEHGNSARFGGTSCKGGCCRRLPPRTVEVYQLSGRFMCGLHVLMLVR